MVKSLGFRVRYFVVPGLWGHRSDMANTTHRCIHGVHAPILFPPLPLFCGISQPNPWVEVIPP